VTGRIHFRPHLCTALTLVIGALRRASLLAQRAAGEVPDERDWRARQPLPPGQEAPQAAPSAAGAQPAGSNGQWGSNATGAGGAAADAAAARGGGGGGGAGAGANGSVAGGGGRGGGGGGSGGGGGGGGGGAPMRGPPGGPAPVRLLSYDGCCAGAGEAEATGTHTAGSLPAFTACRHPASLLGCCRQPERPTLCSARRSLASTPAGCAAIAGRWCEPDAGCCLSK